jgi:hypothetical protein
MCPGMRLWPLTLQSPLLLASLPMTCKFIVCQSSPA